MESTILLKKIFPLLGKNKLIIQSVFKKLLFICIEFFLKKYVLLFIYFGKKEFLPRRKKNEKHLVLEKSF